MKTTYKEILEASGGMSKLLDKQLRPGQAIALARLCRKLNEELALFREEQRRISQGSPVSGEGKDAGNEKDAAELQRKFDELLAVEVEIPGEKVVLTLDEIDAGTVMVTEPFVNIEEAGA